MKQPMTLKGLQEMRTNADTSALVSGLPHKLHMRLCCLEMERHRRDQERRVAMERANKCQARCEQIEQEVRRLLEAIYKQSGIMPVQAEVKPFTDRPHGSRSTAAAGQQTSKPFMHRY